MTELNAHYKIDIDGCKVGITVNRGFINSSFVSHGNMHNHPCYEIHFILYGKNRIKLENMDLVARKGDILLVPPNVTHSIIPVPDEEGHKRAAFWIEFYNSKKNKNPFVQKFKDISEIVLIHDNYKMCSFVEDIQREFIDKPQDYEIKVKASFTMLLIDIYRQLLAEKSIPAGLNSTSCSMMVLIEDYIIKNYNKICTIEALANNLHISRRQLSRLMTKLFGKSFRTLLVETRMSIANYLIDETSLSFEEIAERTGYSSLSAFYHAYYNFYKQTPGEYRKRIQTQI